MIGAIYYVRWTIYKIWEKKSKSRRILLKLVGFYDLLKN
jgi:hypothetical protein